jgi:hypothetical protein
MNPPINRENLRDVLIALVVAIGLVWVVDGFREVRGHNSRTTTHHLSHRTTSAMGEYHPQRSPMSSHFLPVLVGRESRLLRRHA